MSSPFVNEILDLAVEIQQIPAPTFEEHARAEFVQNKFVEAGLQDVAVDEALNVYGRLPGTDADARPVVLSAHTDTVFPNETDLSVTRSHSRIQGPGIGDNSVAVAGLFGVLWQLQAENITLPGDLWLVANSCEEGLGDLKGMRAVVGRFGEQPRAYIILEGMAYGRVFHRGLGVRRFRITARTLGGHSWVDFGRPSAIHALAELITYFNRIMLPVEPRTSLNVGTIQGGTSVNTIASQATIELDLRSVSPKQLKRLSKQVLTLVKSAETADMRFEVEEIGNRPAGELPIEHPLVQLAQTAIEAQGDEVDFNIGSTDANIPLSMGFPAVCIGLTHGVGGHTTEEYILTEPLGRGLSQLLYLLQGAYQLD